MQSLTETKRMSYAVKLFKITLNILGAIGLFMLVMSFTPVPYYAYARLAHPAYDTCNMTPNHIVILSGCGMPSADGLLNCYYASKASELYPDADIVVAIPCNTSAKYSADINITNLELNKHGIDTSLIRYEKNGINTRQQALFTKELLTDSALNDTILIITQPEHINRAIKTFKRAGFNFVTGCATESEPLDEELLKPQNTTTDDEHIGNALALRYNFWNYLKLQVTVAREQVAILYYKIKGWV